MTLTDHRYSVLDKGTFSLRHGGGSTYGDSSQSYSKTIRYINHTAVDIDFKERSGVVVYTNPTPHLKPSVQTIDIEVEWRMTNRMFKRTADLLASDHPGDPLLKGVVRSFDERFGRNGEDNQTTSMTLCISFPLDELYAANGTMYLEELDVTIVTPTVAGARSYKHPYEPRERLKKDFSGAIPFVTAETYIMAIKAVNNGDIARNHDRFMLFGGHVYRVPVEVDPLNQNGIHIVRRRCVDTDPPGTDNVVREHLTFEEADKRFRMYDSAEMARKMGDPEVHFKLELAERQKQQKLDELEQRRVEAEENARLAAARQELERERLIASQRKAKDDLAKDHVRNFGDWMALCGKFLVATLGAITMLAKLSALKPT